MLSAALYAAFQGGRAFGSVPPEIAQPEGAEAAEKRCQALALALVIDTAGRSQAELRRAWFAGDDAVGFDDEHHCYVLD